MVDEAEPISRGVIFSLEEETVWASWPGKPGSIALGHIENVAYMMRDFLEQCDLGQRLVMSRLTLE